MIPSKWALTVESDILLVTMKARYSVSQQGNLSQMHSTLWLPNKSQIRRQWGEGELSDCCCPQIQAPDFLKGQTTSAYLWYCECSRPQNEQAITTPTPTHSFSCSLLLSLAPPYCCVVYTVKWVVLANTQLFSQLEFSTFTLYIRTKYKYIPTYTHTQGIPRGWEVEITDLHKSPAPKLGGLYLSSPPSNSQIYNAWCKPPFLVEVTDKYEKMFHFQH